MTKQLTKTKGIVIAPALASFSATAQGKSASAHTSGNIVLRAYF